MARSKNTPTEPIELPELPAEQITAQQNMVARIEAAYSDDRDTVNQLLGQTQMAGAFEEFSRTVRTSKLAFVKENKLYRAIAGKAAPNGSVFTGTWDEFCSLLGISADKADMDISNLRAFGEEALENMSKMGIGYREMRQYRRLPEDQKLALIEVAKAGDKESFIELAEEIITKHAKEKEALTARATEAESTLEASRQRSAEKTSENEKLREENIRLTRHRAALDPIDLGNEIRESLVGEVTRVELEIRTLRASLTPLMEHGEQHGINHSDFAAGLLAQLDSTIGQLRGEFDIPATGTAEFGWVANPSPEVVGS